MSPCGWRLASGCDPIYKIWDGEAILYDSYSGDTHVVDELCIAIIVSLSKENLSEEQLQREMARCFDLEAEDDLGAMLRQRLDALARLNILQCPE